MLLLIGGRALGDNEHAADQEWDPSLNKHMAAAVLND